MDKRRNHIIFWVGYFVWYFSLVYFSYPDNTPFSVKIIKFFTVYFLEIILFYAMAYIILPNTLLKKKYILFIIFSLCTVLIFAITRYYILLFFDVYYLNNIIKSIFFRNLSNGITSFQMSIYLAFPYCIFKEYLDIEKHKIIIQRKSNSLKKTVSNAELLELKNQINPHFFYNILNFLYAQSLPFSPQLSKAILNLSEIMRYTLRENDDEGKVSLEQEVLYIQNYIQLENLSNYNSKFEINGNLKYRQIFPLTFQPLINHSYKYGSDINFLLSICEGQISFSSNYKMMEIISKITMKESINNLRNSTSNEKTLLDEYNSLTQVYTISLTLNS
jgi:two-component system, LytTR family, sensor kinase